MPKAAKPRSKTSSLTREARQRATAPERLRELAEHAETHRTLARNPSTPPDVLRRLVDSPHRQVVLGVASNKSTSDDLLVELASTADDRLGRALAQRPDLPEDACAELAASPHYSVQWAVVRRKELSGKVVEVLAGRSENSLLRKLVAHASTPASTLAALADDPDPTWALDVLRHASIAPSTVAALREHADPAVRAAADAVSTQQADDGDGVVEPDSSTADPSTAEGSAPSNRTQAGWRQLIRSADHRDRALAVKELETLTLAESELASLDVCWLVRQALARRTDTDPAALRRLAGDPTVEVRLGVAHHSATPADALQQLVDTTVHVKIAGRVARNANTAPATLTQLAEHWPAVHHAIALHENSPTKLLWTMVNQGATRAVRAAVARSANVDQRICVRAANDTDPGVRRTLAANEAATAESLALIVGDKNRGVRAKLAANPSTPQHLLRQMVDDPDPKVRSALAHNRAAVTTDRVLAALI